MLIQALCQSASLKVSHEKKKGVFQDVWSTVLLPDRRYNGYPSFPPEKRIVRG